MFLRSIISCLISILCLIVSFGIMSLSDFPAAVHFRAVCYYAPNYWVNFFLLFTFMFLIDNILFNIEIIGFLWMFLSDITSSSVPFLEILIPRFLISSISNISIQSGGKIFHGSSRGFWYYKQLYRLWLPHLLLFCLWLVLFNFFCNNYLYEWIK